MMTDRDEPNSKTIKGFNVDKETNKIQYVLEGRKKEIQIPNLDIGELYLECERIIVLSGKKEFPDTLMGYNFGGIGTGSSSQLRGELN